jgi:hypothetical protein
MIHLHLLHIMAGHLIHLIRALQAHRIMDRRLTTVLVHQKDHTRDQARDRIINQESQERSQSIPRDQAINFLHTTHIIITIRLI